MIIFLQQIDSATIISFGAGRIGFVAGKFQTQNRVANAALERDKISGRAVFNLPTREFVRQFSFADSADAKDKQRMLALIQVVLQSVKFTVARAFDEIRTSEQILSQQKFRRRSQFFQPKNILKHGGTVLITFLRLELESFGQNFSEQFGGIAPVTVANGFGNGNGRNAP